MKVKIEFDSASVADTVAILQAIARGWMIEPDNEAIPIFEDGKHVGWADCNYEEPGNETVGCEHDWVNRTDGYEEQCGAAICLKCGRYGCWCDAGYGRMTPEQKQALALNALAKQPKKKAKRESA